ncbi:MAG: heavy metal-binding domain-containing protein, partial [Oscillospiraceae bacterium]|nr:heavy metal-binding domain-containing protein [Oscillospiraceae bacterium]
NKDSAQKYQDLYNRAIDELLLTTGSHFEGYKVTKYLDIISCEIIFKNSFLNSLSANLDDFFTSLSFRERELSGSMEQIERAKKHVMAQFRKKAVSLGANAVLGIDFESTFGSDVVKISVNGTAVTVDKIE